MVKVIAVPAGGCASIGVLGQVMTSLTGSALVTAAAGAAVARGVAPLTTPAVTPESPGTLRHTHPVEEETGYNTQRTNALVCLQPQCELTVEHGSRSSPHPLLLKWNFIHLRLNVFLLVMFANPCNHSGVSQ